LNIIQADNNNNLVSRVVSDNVIIELVMSESLDTYIFLYTGLLHEAGRENRERE
jgi:hypothetical protein